MGTGQRPTLPHAPPPPPPPPQPPPALPPLPQPEGEGRWALAELAATIGGLPSPSEVCWASYQSPSLAHAITAGGAEAFAFPPTHAGGEPIGWWQQRLALQRARDDGAPLAAEGWMRLQHRLIVWKLACLQRCLGDPTLAAARQGRGPVPSSSSSAPAAAYAHPGPLEMLSASGVHRALIGRYEREHVHGARPALRRLMGEGEARPLGADAHLVLCICAIDEARGSLELTDGWYTLWAACDAALEVPCMDCGEVAPSPAACEACVVSEATAPNLAGLCNFTLEAGGACDAARACGS